jgi:hypothetical protein
MLPANSSARSVLNIAITVDPAGNCRVSGRGAPVRVSTRKAYAGRAGLVPTSLHNVVSKLFINFA